MSKIVIGIHGLGNKPPAKKLYEQGWKKAILEGIAVNRGITGKDFNFEGVYWADKLYNKPDTNADTYRKAKKGALKSYREGFLEEMIAPIEDLIGSGIDWFKRTFDANDLADSIMKKKLKDLDKYYTDDDIHNALIGRLTEKLIAHADSRIMLVAHSMGSIIAYDTLRQLGRTNSAVSIDHFVTIGSPLGLPHIINKMHQTYGSVKTPTAVKRWTNYADRRDPVAADERLADDYTANIAGVRVVDDLVLNDWRVKRVWFINKSNYANIRKRKLK
ncbi:MAG: hypothetical protein AAF404_17980 [Pseudomonadota bacterium]